MLWTALAFVLLVFVSVRLKQFAANGRTLGWPVRTRVLLTDSEKALYARLCEAFPDHVVLAQVALSQIIEVEPVRNRLAVRNRFNQLVADFVICSRAFEVMAVIELDDRSHLEAGRGDADARKTKVLAAAGHKLVRLHVSRMPDVAELQKRVLAPEAGGAPRSGSRESRSGARAAFG